MFAAIHGKAGDAEKLLRLAQEFSPWVERTTADTVAFDADGLERIYGLPQEIAAALARRASECGLMASVAIAANLDAAVHAARGFAGRERNPARRRGQISGQPAADPAGAHARDAGNAGALGHTAVPRPGCAAGVGPGGAVGRGRAAAAPAGARRRRPAAGSRRRAAPFRRRSRSWNIRWSCWSLWHSCWRACCTACARA